MRVIRLVTPPPTDADIVEGYLQVALDDSQRAQALLEDARKRPERETLRRLRLAHENAQRSLREWQTKADQVKDFTDAGEARRYPSYPEAG